MQIRKAKTSDLLAIYMLGKRAEELKVSQETFMTKQDLLASIKNRNGLFIVAYEKRELVGFGYTDIEGATYASMVYNFVDLKYRKHGLGKKMVEVREKWLRKHGIKSAYLLATNKQIVKIMKRMGYKKGKKLIWMEKKL